MRFRLAQRKSGTYVVGKVGGKTRAWKYVQGVPLKAYERRAKSGMTKKSIFSFIGKGKTVIVMGRKGGRIAYYNKDGKVIRAKFGFDDVQKIKRAMRLIASGKIDRWNIWRAKREFEIAQKIGERKIESLIKKYGKFSSILREIGESKAKRVQLEELTRYRVYSMIAGELANKEKILQKLLKMGSRVDRRLYYIVRFYNSSGEVIGQGQTKNVRPEILREWVKRVINISLDRDIYQGELNEGELRIVGQKIGKVSVNYGRLARGEVAGADVEVRFNTKL